MRYIVTFWLRGELLQCEGPFPDRDAALEYAARVEPIGRCRAQVDALRDPARLRAVPPAPAAAA